MSTCVNNYRTGIPGVDRVMECEQLNEDNVVSDELVRELQRDCTQVGTVVYVVPPSTPCPATTQAFPFMLNVMATPSAQPVSNFTYMQWVQKISDWVLTDTRDHIQVDDLDSSPNEEKKQKTKLTLHCIFEAYVAAWIQCHEMPLAFVERVGKAGDNGIDIRIEPQLNQSGVVTPFTTIVQVKRGRSIKNKIQSILRDLAGACLLHGTKHGKLFTNASTSDFGQSSLQNIENTLHNFLKKEYVLEIYYFEQIKAGIETFNLCGNETQAKIFMKRFITYLPQSWKLAMNLL